MEKALDFGSRASRFESWRHRVFYPLLTRESQFFHPLNIINYILTLDDLKSYSSLHPPPPLKAMRRKISPIVTRQIDKLSICLLFSMVTSASDCT